ncbi:MAG: Fe-S protein assembly co-chaperone HscB [Magnetococcales bacterium]|nr:Fe-S protein assembly co-chaperone HscB [Magnetococcales bacterium]
MTTMIAALPSAGGKSCWSCQGLVTGGSFCPTCQVIQPPDQKQDFFQLFGLPPAFPVESLPLEQTYQSLQKQFHPDRFATRSATERRFSLEQVTRLNQAYQTLRDPLTRSEYLLERLGFVSTGPGQQEAQDPEFLLEVMEQREALAAVPLTSVGMTQLGRLRAQAEAQIAGEHAALARLFAECATSAEPDRWREIARTNHRLRYHRRFLEALDQAEEHVLGS